MKTRQGPVQMEMPASVRDALEVLRPVPAPDADAWSANRSAFLAEAHTYAQQAADLPVPPAAATSWWSRLREAAAQLGAFLLHDGSPMAAALKAAIVIVLVLAGSAGTVNAARESLPGSLLYPLKIRLEAWDIDRAQSPDDVARTALAQADSRVAEAVRLQTRGDAIPNEIVARYQEQLELALATAGGLEPPMREQAEAEISESVRRQLQVVARASAQVEGDAAPSSDGASDPGIQALIRTMRATQARLGQPETPRPEQVAPDNPGYGRDDPVADDADAEHGVDAPTASGGQDEPVGGPRPGPGGTGEGEIDNGSSDDSQQRSDPDTDTPPATDVDEPDDADAPDAGPAQGQNDGTGDSEPTPGDGPNAGVDDAGGPGSDDPGDNGSSDNGSSGDGGSGSGNGGQLDLGGPTNSGRP